MNSLFINLEHALGYIKGLACLGKLFRLFLPQDYPRDFLHGLGYLIGLDLGPQTDLNACQGRTKAGSQQKHQPRLEKIAVFNIIRHINSPPWAVVLSSD